MRAARAGVSPGGRWLAIGPLSLGRGVPGDLLAGLVLVGVWKAGAGKMAVAGRSGTAAAALSPACCARLRKGCFWNSHLEAKNSRELNAISHFAELLLITGVM